jgi:glycosyltransferase involved in cell wall biosynthesis
LKKSGWSWRIWQKSSSGTERFLGHRVPLGRVDGDDPAWLGSRAPRIRTILPAAYDRAVSHDAAVPLLSVVVPVYNQARTILENIATIEERIAAGLGGPFELIVVSDGSADSTDAQLLRSRSDRVRVFHYDRNLGKGYALKLGALQARGSWIGFVDADLDLDPASLPLFLRHGQEHGLDIVIGSKRHPDSVVDYPRSRRVASRLYQRLVRLLFRLDVRDTQVGLKVFRREVADEVLPLLLVKRFAFDLELLAVARSLGFLRIEEQPVALDYRFTGSGVRSLAVLRALLDTAAIFYRLRVLGYYARKHRLLRPLAAVRRTAHAPRVSVVAPPSVSLDALDYEDVERAASADEATGELLAFVGAGSVLAGNWLAATVPFFARDDVDAVVCAALAPSRGGVLARAAAAVQESRLGGGSLYFRFMPGNLRLVEDFPSPSIVVRRSAYAGLAGTPPHDLAAALAERGGLVVYTPETVVVAPVPPLFAPHLGRMAAYGRVRGRALRRRGLRALRASTLLGLGVALLAVATPVVLAGGWLRMAWLAAAAAYALAVACAAVTAALRFRSPLVGALAVAAFPATHAVYAVSVLRGFLARR